MESLFEKVQRGQIWPLTGGIHPEANKSVTANKPIGELALPKTLIVPLKQHLGVAGKLLVKVGDQVLKGQPLTQAGGGLSLPIHAPSSGIIAKIEAHPIAHPSAMTEPCIFIATDGRDLWIEKQPLPRYSVETPEVLIERLKQAGIAGMGGAGFPSFIKSATLRNINYLIVNATECEPYISADDALIREHAESIIKGIDIVAHIVGPQLILIGIEDDKPEAIEALKIAAEHRKDIHVRVFPARYPSGGEKQLIKILTGEEVPAGGLPVDVGILVHNISTLHAIYRAIICGEPLISRIVTVTGGTVKAPQNLEVLVGTPVAELLDYCQFKPQAEQRVIMGGPMMGFTLATTLVPVVKITNCILAPGKNELPSPANEMDCIRCGACADACPVSLLPQQLFFYSKAKEYAKAEEYSLKDCIECGACAYVCPSEIPLVQYYRVAKAEIREEQAEKRKADQAKIRFEARQLRLAAEAQEREEKQRLASEKRKQAMAKTGQSTAVADALARVKAKKAALASAGTHDGTNEATSANSPETPQEAPADPRKAAVAAALARAKAKKQGLAAEPAKPMVEPAEPIVELAEQDLPAELDQKAALDQKAEPDQKDRKKAAVAAAIAKAKAKKQAEAEADGSAKQGDDQPAEQEAPAALDPTARKKAAVAAAIAKAKAKKLAEAEADGSTEQAPEPFADQTAELAEQDPPAALDQKARKKAAVAAAIAKAKAKKQAEAEAEAEAAEPEVAEQIAEPEVAALDSAAELDQTAALDPTARKKAAVAAAIAKAKAKKQAEAEAAEPEVAEQIAEPAAAEPAETAAELDQTAALDQTAVLDPTARKKAAVAAAIAKAKAKKLALEAAEPATTPATTPAKTPENSRTQGDKTPSTDSE